MTNKASIYLITYKNFIFKKITKHPFTSRKFDNFDGFKKNSITLHLDSKGFYYMSIY